MGWPNASSRSLRQEVVRFNMVVQILDMEGLPPKYSTFQVVLQKGGKRISSGELLADEKHRMVPDTGGAATLLFVSSMQRATSGIDFEEKMYKLQLLRVNPRSVMHRLKVACVQALPCVCVSRLCRLPSLSPPPLPPSLQVSISLLCACMHALVTRVACIPESSRDTSELGRGVFAQHRGAEAGDGLGGLTVRYITNPAALAPWCMAQTLFLPPLYCSKEMHDEPWERHLTNVRSGARCT
jgi:hypothetical protein